MIRVMFLVHHDVGWNSLADLYFTMKSSSFFDPVVFTVPTVIDNNKHASKVIIKKITHESSHDNSKWDNVSTDDHLPSLLLTTAGVTHVRLSSHSKDKRIDLIKNFCPEIVIVAAKDDSYYSPGLGLSVKEFALKFKTVYVPYYGATVVEDASLHTRGDLDNYFWKIISDTSIYTRYMIQLGVSRNKIIELGHPKIAQLLKLRRLKGHWPIDGDSKLRVIWSPHWSISDYEIKTWDNNLKFSVFRSMHSDFLKFAKENSDIHFVFRPHPLLQYFLLENGDHSLFVDFLANWNLLPNTATCLDGDYTQIFSESDLLITEGISFLTEYPIITQKPVIFIDSGKHAPFNELGEIAARYSYIVTSFDEIKTYLLSEIPLAAKSSDEIQQFLLPHGEETTKLIVDELHKSLRA